MNDAIALSGGRSLSRDQLGPCRCPGCRFCQSGCSNIIFEDRAWRHRADAASEWVEGFAVRCRVCLPAGGERRNAAGDVVRTAEEVLATVDMRTGAVSAAAGPGRPREVARA